MSSSEQGSGQIDQTRRAFIKTVTYVAPAILTLKAAPAMARQGSQQFTNDGPSSWTNRRWYRRTND